jgi:hypothetical protein
MIQQSDVPTAGETSPGPHEGSCISDIRRWPAILPWTHRDGFSRKLWRSIRRTCTRIGGTYQRSTRRVISALAILQRCAAKPMLVLQQEPNTKHAKSGSRLTLYSWKTDSLCFRKSRSKLHEARRRPCPSRTRESRRSDVDVVCGGSRSEWAWRCVQKPFFAYIIVISIPYWILPVY